MSRRSASSARPTHGPRATRTALRRQQILDATAKTIAQHGYNNASLAQIADEVGISAPSLLHHFSSKAALLTALLAHRDVISLEADLAGQRPEGPELLAHLVATARLNAERSGMTQLYAILVGECLTEGHPAREYFRDRYDGLRGMVRDAVLAAVADEGTDEQDVLDVSIAIIAVMDGLQYQYLLSPEHVDMARVTERTIRALLDDLGVNTVSSRR